MSELVEEVKRTPMRRRQKVMLVGLGLIILCSGFVLGSSVTFNYLKDRLRPPAPPIRAQVDWLVKEYDLNDQQRKKVTPILEEYHQALIKTWEQSTQIMATARDRLVDQMKKVLTTEQYESWFSDLKEREERRRRRMSPDFRRGDRGRSGRDRGRDWNRDRGDRPWRDSNRMPDMNEQRPSEEMRIQESNDMP